MSAETEYFQDYLDLFDDLWQNPIRRQYNLTLGVEITATEANVDIVDPRFQPMMGPGAPPQGPGQTSYARGIAETYMNLGHGRGFTGSSYRASLSFPEVNRVYAFTGDRHGWWDQPPFSGARTAEESVTLSLLPFTGHRLGIPVEPDDQVHVEITYAARPGTVSLLENVRLEPVSQQLLGTTASQDVDDAAALWVISFFLAARPPG